MVDDVISQYPKIENLNLSSKHRILFAQAVLHHFISAEFKYFMWMEGDMWVQDSSYLKNVFGLIDENQPDVVVFAPKPLQAYAEQYSGNASRNFILKYGHEIIGNRCFMGGLNIRKTHSKFTSDYEFFILDIFDLGGSICFEEWAASLSFYRNKNTIFINDDTSGTTTEGHFGVNFEGKIVNPENGAVIGIVHVAAYGPNDERAFSYQAIEIEKNRIVPVSIYNPNSPRFKK